MKKIIYAATLIAVTVFSSCKKADDNNNGGGGVTGSWTISKWDNSSTAGTGSLDLKSDGTSDFQITWSGAAVAKTETGTYETASDNSTITFTKTGGDVNYLSGGGTWTINSLDANNLKITSQNGLVAEFTK